MDSEIKRKYGDIIDLPNHKSQYFKHMTLNERAAQFSPFAALVGHGDAIRETARLTDKFIELTNEEKLLVSEKLALLLDNASKRIEASVTYFVPDEKKSGGRYETFVGCVEKYLSESKKIKLSNGNAIKVEHIVSIKCNDLFEQ